MKYWSLILVVLVILTAIPSFAVTRTSNGGNWSTPATWGGTVPAAGDDVILASGTTNVDAGLAASTTILSLTINGTAILDFNTANRTIVVTLVTTMNGNSLIDNSPNNNGGNKILSMLGDFNVPALQAARIDGITLTQPVAKNFTVSGNFQPTNNKGTKTLGNLIVNKTGSWTATTNETYTFQGTSDLYEGCVISGASTGVITMTGNV